MELTGLTVPRIANGHIDCQADFWASTLAKAVAVCEKSLRRYVRVDLKAVQCANTKSLP